MRWRLFLFFFCCCQRLYCIFASILFDQDFKSCRSYNQTKVRKFWPKRGQLNSFWNVIAYNVIVLCNLFGAIEFTSLYLCVCMCMCVLYMVEVAKPLSEWLAHRLFARCCTELCNVATVDKLRLARWSVGWRISRGSTFRSWRWSAVVHRQLDLRFLSLFNRRTSNYFSKLTTV